MVHRRKKERGYMFSVHLINSEGRSTLMLRTLQLLWSLEILLHSRFNFGHFNHESHENEVKIMFIRADHIWWLCLVRKIWVLVLQGDILFEGHQITKSFTLSCDTVMMRHEKVPFQCPFCVPVLHHIQLEPTYPSGILSLPMPPLQVAFSTFVSKSPLDIFNKTL